MRKNVASLVVLCCLVFAGCKTKHPNQTELQSPRNIHTVTVEPAPIENVPVVKETPKKNLRVPHLFSDNMVLQQSGSVPVWGWAKNGETVTVTFGPQQVVTKAEGGKWSVNLRNLKPGEANILNISTSSESVHFTNVLVGEVWVCSGQSNMEWPLYKSFEPQNDIATATNTLIRLFVVPNVKSDTLCDDVEGHWEVCSPQTITNFSAVAYYFGRNLQSARRTAVGLIQSDWGGTPIESWTSHSALANNPVARREVLDTYPTTEKLYQDALADYERKIAEAKARNLTNNIPKPYPPHKPSELYNGMIAPLVPFAMRGVIWYQGENNVPRAAQYRALLPTMIRDWRRAWDNEFPFCIVQIAPFKAIKPQPSESDWAELREAQFLTSKVTPKVALTVITDVGEEFNIHPKKKAPVGERLALAARAIAYGEKLTYSGPLYKSMRIEQDRAVIKFDQVGSGLVARGPLKSFAICGEDKKWVWGIAEIQNADTVVVSSPNIEKPVAVRFGWADYPIINLYNKEGLPASPFRTDNFPMISEGKK